MANMRWFFFHRVKGIPRSCGLLSTGLQGSAEVDNSLPPSRHFARKRNFDNRSSSLDYHQNIHSSSHNFSNANSSPAHKKISTLLISPFADISILDCPFRNSNPHLQRKQH
ncbi:hypothetical protein NPIL_373801 [Nephila pilipes]|uniref:Uncharacterized protein n=1 Tax=Nephila pilipes TaxID=299642 RepID=A0A8X6TT49_NEPPI|nr:hypothetical protein NPIL_373801 [Nephila pilipes]